MDPYSDFSKLYSSVMEDSCTEASVKDDENCSDAEGSAHSTVPDIQLAEQCVDEANKNEYEEPSGIELNEIPEHMNGMRSHFNKKAGKKAEKECISGDSMDSKVFDDIMKEMKGLSIRSGLFAYQSLMMMAIDICGKNMWSVVPTYEKGKGKTKPVHWKISRAMQLTVGKL